MTYQPFRIRATRLDDQGNPLSRGPHFLSFEIPTGLWTLVRHPNGTWRATFYRDAPLDTGTIIAYNERHDS